MKAIVAIMLASCFLSSAQQKELLDSRLKAGAYSQVMKNQDGTTAYLSKDPRNPGVIEKKTYDDKNLIMLTIYRLDDAGNPLNCKIYDGLKQELFKTKYGYDRNTGNLVEEQMYDSRVLRRDPATNEEMPVRRFLYLYDANGKQSKAVSIVLQPGKVAEDVYKMKGKYAEHFTNPSGLDKAQLKSLNGK